MSTYWLDGSAKIITLPRRKEIEDLTFYEKELQSSRRAFMLDIIVPRRHSYLPQF